jgi:hypothetical protein
MRAVLLLLAAAFEPELHVDAPTEDPEESEIMLIDEYDTEGDLSGSSRSLQYMINGTNTTSEESSPGDIPMLPLAVVGLGGVAVVGYFITRPGHTYETYSYEEAAESGLLDHPDYDVHTYDGEYDSDYE